MRSKERSSRQNPHAESLQPGDRAGVEKLNKSHSSGRYMLAVMLFWNLPSLWLIPPCFVIKSLNAFSVLLLSLQAPLHKHQQNQNSNHLYEVALVYPVWKKWDLQGICMTVFFFFRIILYFPNLQSAVIVKEVFR